MVGYNLTGIASNSTSPLKFIQFVNDQLMFGWYGTLFLISFSVILVMGFYYSTQDIAKSLSGAAFIAFCMAIFMRMFSMIGELTLYITLIVAAATIAVTWRKD